jgi:hypothetical protein
MAVERRTIWLGIALVIALLAFIVVRSMDESPTVAPRAASGRATARGRQQATAETAPDVNLAMLERSRGEPADGERNPFRFRPKPPPPPPPITLKFIGIVQKADGTRIAVLSDGKRPYYGVDGQDIEGQYRILKIGQESIEISYIDGRGRQTIRLSGQ